MHISDVLDNRWFQRFLFPIAIYNLCKSVVLTKKEFDFIKDSINTNDEFFKSIATLGFVPNGWLPELKSVMPIQDELSIDEVHDIAKKNIIAVIMHYVKSEQLLGVITVKCEIVKSNVVVLIQPKSLQLLLIDVYDSVISLSVSAAIALIAYFVFV